MHRRPSLVKEANRRVVSGAERFLFYHERRDWIATLADKPHPFLSRIQYRKIGGLVNYWAAVGKSPSVRSRIAR